jgi:hypothetical protein
VGGAGVSVKDAGEDMGFFVGEDTRKTGVFRGNWRKLEEIRLRLARAGSESGKEFGEYDKRLSHTPLKKPTLSGAYGRSGGECCV